MIVDILEIGKIHSRNVVILSSEALYKVLALVNKGIVIGKTCELIVVKFKIESSVLTQFATSDEWKTEISSFSYDLKSYERLWEIEEKFQFQGIIIRESWKDPDPETLVGTLCYKVYGDQKEGVRRYMQKKCDRYGEQMEVEYI